MAGKILLARRCNEGWIEDSSFKSSQLSRLRSPDGLAVFFLRPISEVLIAEKKKQTSLSFDKVRSHPYHFTVELRARPTHLSWKKRCCKLRLFEFFMPFLYRCSVMRYQENKAYQSSLGDGPKWRFKGELVSDEMCFRVRLWCWNAC